MNNYVSSNFANCFPDICIKFLLIRSGSEVGEVEELHHLLLSVWSCAGMRGVQACPQRATKCAVALGAGGRVVGCGAGKRCICV